MALPIPDPGPGRTQPLTPHFLMGEVSTASRPIGLVDGNAFPPMSLGALITLQEIHTFDRGGEAESGKVIGDSAAVVQQDPSCTPAVRL